MDSKLIQRLDNIFAKYVKLRDTDQYGYGVCIATKKRICYKMVDGRWVSNCDAGHYISRANFQTRWMKENVNAQEVVSNRNGFSLQSMAENIESKWGVGTIERIHKKEKEFGQKTYEIDNHWLIEKIEYYEREVSILLKNKMF